MKYFLVSIILFPYLIISQTLIGSDIDGESSGDFFGRSISLSSDGNIVAISGPGNDGNGSDSGHVRVFKNESGVWTQIGSDIDGEASSDGLGGIGIFVSLSSNGNVVAIGAIGNDGNGFASGHVRVYKNESDVWTQVGSDIDGESIADFSGRNISLSSDGNVIAIGASGNDGNGSGSGHVRIFKNESNVWTQIGSDIDGEAAGDAFGSSGLSLSSDGNIVAIGAVGNNGNGSESGHVRVFKNELGVWTQIGSDIDGEATGDAFGRSVSLSLNGEIVAIGGDSNDGNGIDSGHVRIFKNESNVWTQIGSDIDGGASGDAFGTSVSLSSDGDIVAIGAPANDNNGLESGQVKIYKNESGIWTQIGSNINGESVDDASGSSVSLSSDGSIVAIGAFRNDGNGSNSGSVRVYDLNLVLSNETFKNNYFSYYPNPVKNFLEIDVKKGLDFKQINIYNIQNQFLFSTKKQSIDVSNLTSGLYFIEVETNLGKSTKKFIIE